MKKGLIVAVACLAVSGVLTACAGKDIGAEKAKQIAFKDAGAEEAATSRVWVSSEKEDGKVVYEIDFKVKESGIAYEYEIQGADGSIVKTESEDVRALYEEVKGKQDLKEYSDQNMELLETLISEQETTVTELQEQLKTKEDGPEKEALEKKLEEAVNSLKDFQQEKSNQDTFNEKNNLDDIKINIEEASQIALERVSEAGEDDIKIVLENDDGKHKYEGDIIYEQKKYEFEIDAKDGSVLAWSEEKM